MSKSSKFQRPQEQAINRFRAELWGQALGGKTKTDFVCRAALRAKSTDLPSHPASAILYAIR